MKETSKASQGLETSVVSAAKVGDYQIEMKSPGICRDRRCMGWVMWYQEKDNLQFDVLASSTLHEFFEESGMSAL